jgi:hypothetical protein
MTDTRYADDAVRDLQTAIEWLTAVLLPGTHKPYRPPSMTPDARAERDRLARLERLERSGIAPGETPAPLDLDVADLLSEILSAADELADLVSDTARVARMPSAPSAFTDPEPYLIHVTDLLPACRKSPVVVRSVEVRCDELTRRAHETLGLLGDGQVLDVVCPWCDGRMADRPVGGVKTLRVRAQLPAGRPMARVDPAEVRWLVVCESGTCSPEPADCGERVRGRPAWPLNTEGEWLAMRLERAS